MAQEKITAPLPGKLLEVNVKVGQKVKEGDTICTLESMKMEVPVMSPVNGTVTEVHIAAGPDKVLTTGQLIAVVEY